MMIPTENKLTAVTHPLVAQMYLKKEFRNRRTDQEEDVLVIETKFPVDGSDTMGFNACLSDLLSDLPDLQTQAEARVGHIDRVDIRAH